MTAPGAIIAIANEEVTISNRGRLFLFTQLAHLNGRSCEKKNMHVTAGLLCSEEYERVYRENLIMAWSERSNAAPALMGFLQVSNATKPIHLIAFNEGVFISKVLPSATKWLIVKDHKSL